MQLAKLIEGIDWGSLYVASEWALRVAALVYVPQRRPPAAARAWLLLILFLPWPGVLLYVLIGRAYLPRRRYRLQRQIAELTRSLLPAEDTGRKRPLPDVSPGLVPAFELVNALSEFPPVAGCRFELLPAYDAAIARLVAGIDGARRQVHLLFYIFAADEVGDAVAAALERAARRGVVVRVLMDAIGSRSGLARYTPGLRAAGAEVIAMMPLRLWGPNAARFDLRNHRKVVVIDGEVAFFGSQNIVSSHANRGMTNEELLVRATGAVVQQLDAVLLGDRYLETGSLPSDSGRLPSPSPAPVAGSQGVAQVVPSGPGYNEGTAEAVMIALMHGARSRIVLTAPYVVPSEAFLGAMTSAARRGVAVALIVDAESNKPFVQLAQQSFYDAMLDAGVTIHHHRGSFLHAKHLSVDEEVALIGSSNFDIRSFALNAEVSVLICDRGVVEDLAAVQRGYLARCVAVTRETRLAAPRIQRILENLARLTDSLL